MSILEKFLAGSGALFGDPFTIAIFVFGVIGGMLFGAIPGVSMLTLAAILLPFTADLEPAQGVMLFAVIYCTGTYGGAITAILFNIPGAPENAPTAFDGYPMTRQGKSGKAVGAAVLCSAIGGVASALVMMAATEPLANWAIRNIGPPEIFALVFFGLAVASSVGGRTIWKGWMSVLLGLMIATVGQDPVGGINRYNFGFTDLAAGIAFVPAILGFFAVSEIFVQAEKKATGKYDAPKLGMSFPTVLELWMHKFAVIRSILVGFFCGILPGIGATLAAFMGYGEAVRWSKNKEEFGKGKLEGVISSETANNAATGAAMIPLLALGLPGGALTAMMVAVFQMHDPRAGAARLLQFARPDLDRLRGDVLRQPVDPVHRAARNQDDPLSSEDPVPVPGPADPAAGDDRRLYQPRAGSRRDGDVRRRYSGLPSSPYGLLDPGDRSRPDPRQDRRAEFRAGHADGALRPRHLFLAPDLLDPDRRRRIDTRRRPL